MEKKIIFIAVFVVFCSLLFYGCSSDIDTSVMNFGEWIQDLMDWINEMMDRSARRRGGGGF